MDVSKEVVQWAQKRGIYRGGQFRVGIRDATYEDINPEDRTFVVTISSVRKDRAGDVVEPRGALLDDYKRNPVVLWAHSYDLPPIARSQWIRITDSALKSKTEFAKTKLAEEIYGLYADHFLNAWSIGFMPVEVEAIYDKHDDEDPRPSGMPNGYRFNKWDLLEYSAVPVPMNPDAVTDMIKSGKMSEQLLIKSFKDYVPDLSKPEEGFDKRIEEMSQADTERDKEVAEAVKQMGKDGVMVNPEPVGQTDAIAPEMSKDAPTSEDNIEVDINHDTATKEVFNCECIDCGYTMESKEHCKDLKCPECGGQMRRKERPGPGQDSADKTVEKPYPNEHACRLKEPDDFEADSFRRTKREHEGKEYSVISGKLKGEDEMTEQAYRYDRDVWDVDVAERHCADHEGNFEPAATEGAEQSDGTIEIAEDDARLETMVEKTKDYWLERAPYPVDVVLPWGEILPMQSSEIYELGKTELERALGALNVDDLDEILKEGRVLSSKNRTLINDAISTMRKSIDALQELLDATSKEDSADVEITRGAGSYDTPDGYDEDEEVIEIEDITSEEQEEGSDASDDEIELEVTGDELGKHIQDTVTGVIRRLRGSVN
jgi:predicted RNA-binding Zn-ribbon protein involved in translation (DUF1610 family)